MNSDSAQTASLRECVDAAVAAACIVRGGSVDQSHVVVVAHRGVIRRLVIAERAASGDAIEAETVISVAVGGVARECAGDIIHLEAERAITVGLVAGDDVQLAALGTATIPDTTGEGGAIVREVIPGLPAEAAGLRVGDRIITVDGDAVSTPGDLFAAVVTHRPGTSVEVEFVRGDATQLVSIVLGGIKL